MGDRVWDVCIERKLRADEEEKCDADQGERDNDDGGIRFDDGAIDLLILGSVTDKNVVVFSVTCRSLECIEPVWWGKP